MVLDEQRRNGSFFFFLVQKKNAHFFQFSLSFRLICLCILRFEWLSHRLGMRGLSLCNMVQSFGWVFFFCQGSVQVSKSLFLTV
jgi:hypothetical protein